MNFSAIPSDRFKKEAKHRHRNRGKRRRSLCTGRAYFKDKEMEQALLQRVNAALFHSGFYERFQTDWVCLDCELMPSSAKAQTLIESQYASTGVAATHYQKAFNFRY